MKLTMPRRIAVTAACCAFQSSRSRVGTAVQASTKTRTPVSRYLVSEVTEGTTKREALRSLKRHMSKAHYWKLVLDAG